jgi:hypothetical protein
VQCKGGELLTLRDLDEAAEAARSPKAARRRRFGRRLARQLAYFQGRYSQANGIVDCAVPSSSAFGDLRRALALRVRIAIFRPH